MNSVPIESPVKITSPMLMRDAAPAPRRITSGTTPSTIAAVVMRIGRKRIAAASLDRFALRACPACCSSLANSTIRMPCLLMRPISVTRPTWV